MRASSKTRAKAAVSVLAACLLALPAVPVAAFAGQASAGSIGADMGSGSASLVVERNRAYYESVLPNVELAPENLQAEYVRLEDAPVQAGGALECKGDGYID